MDRFIISAHCRYVKGKCGSALYDLKNGTVFRLNADATSVLDDALSGVSVAEYYLFINSLCEKELLNCTTYPEYAHKHECEKSLRYVWLELTNCCNFRCLHCYGAFGMPPADNQNHELTTGKWLEVLDYIKSRGCTAIQFIGGEPLLHPDFKYILQYAYDIGINNIDIFTNGYFLTSEIIEVIKKVHASVRVSLYGHNKEVHDKITQFAGSFQSLDSALSLLKKENIPTNVAVVLMRENQLYLNEIIEYIERKGHKYSGYDTVRSVKHCLQNSHAVTNKTILMQRYVKKSNFTTSYDTYYRNKQWNSCWYGKFAVTAQGEVIPCIFSREFVCGNISKDSFEDIENKLLSYWRITKDSVITCQDCEFRYACDDCRPLSYSEGENLFSKYPRCFYSPERCEWDEI